LIEDEGNYYLTETQKNIARIHRIQPSLVDGLFHQWDRKTVSKDGLILEISDGSSTVPMPPLVEFNKRDTNRLDYGTKELRNGFSIDLWLTFDSLRPGQILFDNCTDQGAGIRLTTGERGKLKFAMNDGRQEASWPSDSETLRIGQPQHVVITIDGGPKIITYVINGILCDGGDERQFGWGRYSPTLRTPHGRKTLTLDKAIRRLRIYNRPLTTGEAIGNFRTGE
jgi:hypothetical protein